MKQPGLYCFTILLLICVLTINGCSYTIPESNSIKAYPTPPPRFIENRQTDISGEKNGTTDIPVQQLKNLSVERKNIPPVADFSLLPNGELYVGMKIYFNADSSNDPDGDYLEYYWNFGDGNPLFGPTTHNPVCHTYFIKGDYLVRLIVFDNSGDFSVKELKLHIREF